MENLNSIVRCFEKVGAWSIEVPRVPPPEEDLDEEGREKFAKDVVQYRAYPDGELLKKWRKELLDLQLMR